MQFRYFVLLLHLLLLCHLSFGQKKVTALGSGEDVDASPTNLAMAKYEINDIKTKGIIIRIRTNKDRIIAYRKAGNEKVASQMEEKAETAKLLIELAFVTKWTYCPVYFMESQYTSKLMREDTLIAKTPDLLRDTALYCQRDSFYIIDFGDLMANEASTDNITYKNIHHTQQSANQVGTDYFVVKNAAQEQLQEPFPYYSRVMMGELSQYKYVTPIEIPQDVANQMAGALKKYTSTADMIKSDDKQVLFNYVRAVYDHVENPANNNAYQKAVSRLNKRFIAYYCSRLDKDKNILCNDDPYYWWQRNPNIRYIAGLRALELKLKGNSDKDEQFIKPH